MTDTKTLPVKKVTKKEARKIVYEKLSGVLSEYQNGSNKKQFENKLKKASKLFAVVLAKSNRKNGKLNGKVTTAREK
jgi:hypothetical protein